MHLIPKLYQTLEQYINSIPLAFSISYDGKFYLSRFTYLIFWLCLLDLERFSRFNPLLFIAYEGKFHLSKHTYLIFQLYHLGSELLYRPILLVFTILYEGEFVYTLLFTINSLHFIGRLTAQLSYYLVPLLCYRLTISSISTKDTIVLFLIQQHFLPILL